MSPVDIRKAGEALYLLRKDRSVQKEPSVDPETRKDAQQISSRRLTSVLCLQDLLGKLLLRFFICVIVQTCPVLLVRCVYLMQWFAQFLNQFT